MFPSENKYFSQPKLKKIMKKTIAVITAIGALSGGLFGQLDFGTLTDITDNDEFFPLVAKAMHNDRTSLNNDQFTFVPPSPPSKADQISAHMDTLYTQFVVEYNLDPVSLLPDPTTGQITTGTLASTPDPINPGTDLFESTLRFQLMAPDPTNPPNNFPRFLLGDGPQENFLTLEVSYIHSDAAARNSFGISKNENPALDQALELYHYHKFLGEGPDVPPKSYELAGTGESDQFSFYAEVDYAPGDPPDPRPEGPHFQVDNNYWRVFELVDLFGNPVDERGNPRVQGTVPSVDPTLYVLALEDQGIHPGSNYDFNDGFFLIRGFVTPVPEPSVIGLGGIAALLGFIAYRRRKNKAA